MNYNYLKSTHDVALAEALPKTQPIEPQFERLKGVVLAFVNRSGSNYLAELMRSTGLFVGLDECFNDHTVKYLSPRYQVESLDAYIRRIHDEQNPTHQFWGFKAGWQQLCMLLRLQALPNLLDAHVVYIKRRDIVGQAVSMCIAQKTNAWMKKRDENNNNNIDIDEIYNFDEIVTTIKNISFAYNKFEELLCLAQLKTTAVIYENLLDDPYRIISNISENLTGQAVPPNIANVAIEVQRSDLNIKIRQRFINDTKMLRWEAI